MHRFRLFAACVLVAVVWATLVLQAAGALELPHHDIQLRVDPDERTVSIWDRITVSGRPSLRISVARWMRITDVRVDGTPVREIDSFRSLLVTLPSTGKHQIEVDAYGFIPKLDPENDRQRLGSAAVAGSEGVYLPSWARWHPRSSERAATFLLSVVTPSDYRAAATGALVSEALGPSENIAVFKSQTMMEPPSVFVGPYRVAERRSGKIRIRTYFHQSAAGLMEAYLDAAERYISIFEKGIGPYPFADFHMVSAPLPVGLGFPNMAYVDRRILRLPFMRGRSLSHEVLHNWWGHGVQADYKAGNWSEGLTTYMADHALAEQRSKQAGRDMRLGWLRDYAALPPQRDIPVTRFIAKRHDAAQVVGYGKPAYIFHMLKHETGSDQFSAAVKRFWQTYKFRVAGWQDIEATFEASVKTDLGWFFRQWTERAGAPQLTLKDARVSHKGNGYLLVITLGQDAPAYRLKVPVQVTTEAGQIWFNVRLDAESATAKLQLEAKPVRLQIDPDHTLFRRLLPNEAPPIMRDILLDKSANTLVLHEDPDSEQLARELAARLFDGSPNFHAGDQISKTTDEHLLVLGSAKQISELIASLELPARPAEISGRGSGRAWTARKQSGKAVLFVEADDAEALRAMMRPLPHYRSKSYIVFEGRRAVARGVWLATDGPLTKRLD
jgi:aminopeptidase N